MRIHLELIKEKLVLFATGMGHTLGNSLLMDWIYLIFNKYLFVAKRWLIVVIEVTLGT